MAILGLYTPIGWYF